MSVHTSHVLRPHHASSVVEDGNLQSIAPPFNSPLAFVTRARQRPFFFPSIFSPAPNGAPIPRAGAESLDLGKQ